MICIFTRYYSGDQIKNIEMGGACVTYGGEERRIQGFRGQIQGIEMSWKN